MGRGGKNFWLLGAFSLLGTILIVFIIYFVWQEMSRSRSVQEEIAKLQEEAEKINRENNNIAESISYLTSKEYKEKEAKEKLNLQSPGEKVVIIKPSPSEKNVQENVNEKASQIISPEVIMESNLKKWWNYFFKYEN